MRILLVRFLRGKDEILSEDQRRNIIRIKNVIWTCIFLCVVFIWAPELQTLAFSLTAIAVAIVIATKELILCFSGSLMRMFTQPFRVGDWIGINGIYGEVIDVSALDTRVQELEFCQQTFAFTGRTIRIPNAWLLSYPVSNLHFMKEFVFKEFSIVVQYADLDPSVLFEKLQEISDGKYSAHEKEAATVLRKVSRKSGVSFDSPAPRIFLKTSDVGHNIFTVRLFLPMKTAHATATLITKEFLSFVHALKTEKKAALS